MSRPDNIEKNTLPRSTKWARCPLFRGFCGSHVIIGMCPNRPICTKLREREVGYDETGRITDKQWEYLLTRMTPKTNPLGTAGKGPEAVV